MADGVEEGVEWIEAELLIKTPIGDYHARDQKLGVGFYMATPVRLVEKAAHAAMARTDFTHLGYVIEYRASRIRCLKRKRGE